LPGSIRCAACSAEYEHPKDALNFITPAMRDQFRIDATDNVSGHGYDPAAMEMIESGGMVLDCGAGRKDVSFPNLIQMEVVNYPLVDVLAVNQTLPFRDACFDAVLSLAVLEHVDQPFHCAAEIIRVMKPGARLYANVPFLQTEHGYPHHYFGMTRMGLRRLFDGMLDVELHHVPMSGHPIWTVWTVLRAYRDGLPPEQRDEFTQLKVEDILSRDPIDWLASPLVAALSEAAQWEIASTTTLIGTKRVA
ncbi:MAG: methyltransferase domain-containing protein, partial [Pseudomonadota bacterium]